MSNRPKDGTLLPTVLYLEDVLDRIATEWPKVVKPCGCPAGAACSMCEITFLLDEYQKGKPDGPSE